jgi:replicative DNA helicase
MASANHQAPIAVDPDRIALQKGLPVDLPAERLILGSVVLNGDRLPEVGGLIQADDFALESHRVIYRRIVGMAERGAKVDRVTLCSELHRFGELQAVGGMSAIADLDTGLPMIPNLAEYIRIVRDKSSLRRIILTSQHVMNRALTAEETPDEILASAEEQLLGIGESRQSTDEGLMSSGRFLRGFPGGLQSFVEPARRENGLRSGFTKLDDMTGGFRPGELVIFAARPGQGKSALMLNVAWNAAVRFGIPVGIFSLEMSRESLLLRMLCSAARVDSHRLRTGYLNSIERDRIRKAANLLADAPIYIDDSSNIGLMELHAKVRRLESSEKLKIGLLCVDYLQLMASRGNAENRNQEVTRISRGLKLLSKKDQLDCAVLALSQLSRATETRNGDKRPQLSDLKESGSIEENADMVAAIYRAETYHKDREDLRGLAELIVLKQRGGPIGTVNLVWLAAQTRFESQAEDVGDSDSSSDESRLPYVD